MMSLNETQYGTGRMTSSPVLDQDLNCIEQHMFSADGNDCFLTFVVRAKVRSVPLNNRVAAAQPSPQPLCTW
jgi:hypothetical protein